MIKLKEIYQMLNDEVFKLQATDGQCLTNREAAERKEKYGENVLEEGTKKTAFQRAPL